MTATPIGDRLDDPDVASGRRKIDWARDRSPIQESLRADFADEQPLDGHVVGMAMHVEATTAVLAETTAAAGAEVAITGCNPLSTHDDVSAALDAQDGITSYAERGVDDEAYYDAMDAVIDHEPTITVDDGGDLIFRLHEEYPEQLDRVIGGCEETTTGVHRLRAMADDDALTYPVFAVNDTPMKRLFDNVHGTGESSLTAIAATTNSAIAGSTVVVAGYGYCGKGIAGKADGLDAHVIVTETDPRRALEAHMAGHEVMPMAEAATRGDLFVTATGNRDVITVDHARTMPDGATLANAGHFDVEIDVAGLREAVASVREVRDGVTEFEFPDGSCVNLVAEGRLVNLASPPAQGHPIEVMDQSFGVQASCIREIAARADDYDAGVHEVPDAIDRDVAETKLAAEGIAIDDLSDAQTDYLSGWRHGT